MKLMNLGVLVILQNTIMNLLPWGGPTARAMAVLEVDADILFLFSTWYDFICIVCYLLCCLSHGEKERARLGVTTLTDKNWKK